MKITYQEFLTTLTDSFEVRRLKDHAQVSNRSICLLRHDIDSDMPRALRMAKIEAQLGIRSTYFVLHTAAYYSRRDFCEECLKLQDMGHEVGLHNDILTECMLNKVSPEETLYEELDYLHACGLEIEGTSAHGNSLCRKFKYINYEIFKGCSPSYWPMRSIFGDIELHTLDLQKYGLYEAYFIPRDYYITDCQSSWRYIAGNSDEWHPDFRSESPVVNDIQEFLQKIARKHIVLQALIHPSLNLIEV